ncbi:MAG: NAD(P)/FAD-dependent oxidoreductase [Actinomycetota bacterium]|nr:NAD(P)/FAD-dependent oxidoreductase [Actinomycetota bacterium]
MPTTASHEEPPLTTVDHDVIVVGGGPAGLAAATWLSRYRRSVLVLDGGPPRSWSTDVTHGYLGRDSVSPAELLEQARADLASYPTAVRHEARAATVRAEDQGRFVVTTDGGEEIVARRLVLATGVTDDLPPVAGMDEHYGASAFHCPTCDGYEARDRRVVVLGWGSQVAGVGLELLDWARDVTIVTAGQRFEGDERHRQALERHGIELVEEEAAELVGPRHDLQAVALADGRRLPCDLVFFSIAHHPQTDLAGQLGCELTDQGCLQVDECGRTSVDGVFGAGDVTPGIQLVQVAAAKGAIAGVTCALSLAGEPGAAEAPAPGPDAGSEVP